MPIDLNTGLPMEDERKKKVRDYLMAKYFPQASGVPPMPAATPLDLNQLPAPMPTAPEAPAPAPTPDPYSPEERAKLGESGNTTQLIGEILSGLGDAFATSRGTGGTKFYDTARKASEASRAEKLATFDAKKKAVQDDKVRAYLSEKFNLPTGIDVESGEKLATLEQAKQLREAQMKESASARDEAAAERQSTRETSREEREAYREALSGEKRTKQDEDRTQGIRKEITGSKSYQSWLDIKNASDNLQNAATNPTAKRTLGAIYSYVKALDPGSVVREGEITLSQSARSGFERVEGYFRRLATGQVLNPDEVKEMAEWAKEKEDLAKQTAVGSNKPAIEQATRLGFNLSEINSDLFGQPAASKGTQPPVGGAGQYADAEKEKRYQEWKAQQK